MEQKLVIHKAIHNPCKGDIVIQLTDLQLHTNARVTPSLDKTIGRSIESNKPGRVFFPLGKKIEVIENNTVVFRQQIFNYNQLLPLVQRYQKQGRRVFILKPKNEMPVSLGNDAVEFINGTKGGRKLRRSKKQEQVI